MLDRQVIWDALYRLFPGLRGRFGIASLNDPGNAITLLPPLHKLFGRFEMAFEATVRLLALVPEF